MKKYIYIVFTLLIYLLCGCESIDEFINFNDFNEQIQSFYDEETYVNFINNENNKGKILNLCDYSKDVSPFINSKPFLSQMRHISNSYKELWETFTDLTGIIIKEILNEDALYWVRYGFPDRFKNNSAQILSGAAPDILFIPNQELSFYVSNGLVLPITEYLSLFKNYVGMQYQDDELFGLNISIVPGFTLWYNESVRNEQGLNDPIEMWLKNKWDWGAWSDMLMAVNSSNVRPILKPIIYTEFLRVAILASNGVEYVSLNEYGQYQFALDERYVEAVDMYDDLVSKSLINNVNDSPSKNRMGFFAGESYMLYDFIGNIFTNNEGVLDAYMQSKDLYGIVSIPNGPSLSMDRTSRDIGNPFVYAVASSCKEPKAAVAYLSWMLSDEDEYNYKKSLAINNLNFDERIINIGPEWDFNSAFIYSQNIWGDTFDRLINDPNMKLNEKLANDCQETLNKYINIFPIKIDYLNVDDNINNDMPINIIETALSNFEYEYDDKNIGFIINKYIGESTEVRIPRLINDKPVIEIGFAAFENSIISYIYFPDTIKYIKPYAFQGCEKLMYIMMDNYDIFIDKTSFNNCHILSNSSYLNLFKCGLINYEIIEFCEYEWIVLDRDGDNTLLLSLYALFELPFQYVNFDFEEEVLIEEEHYKYNNINWNENSLHIHLKEFSNNLYYDAESKLTNTTWENSTVRKYLNNEFYSNFLLNDKIKIINTHVLSEDPIFLMPNIGNDTYDYIFLLSYYDVEKYLPDSARMTFTLNLNPIEWWTRTRESSGKSRLIVNIFNDIRFTKPVNSTIGVRPAMWVNFNL